MSRTFGAGYQQAKLAVLAEVSTTLAAIAASSSSAGPDNAELVRVIAFARGALELDREFMVRTTPVSTGADGDGIGALAGALAGAWSGAEQLAYVRSSNPMTATDPGLAAAAAAITRNIEAATSALRAALVVDVRYADALSRVDRWLATAPAPDIVASATFTGGPGAEIHDWLGTLDKLLVALGGAS